MAVLMIAGAASYARQSLLLIGPARLPGAFNAAAIVVLRYGAYPRSFLYVLPFVLLMAVRGAAVLGRLFARRSLPEQRRARGARMIEVGERYAPRLRLRRCASRSTTASRSRTIGARCGT